MTIKSIDGVTTYQTLTTTNGGIIFNGTSGLIDLIITATQTASLGWKQASYELLVIDPNTNETLPLLVGRLSAVSSL